MALIHTRAKRRQRLCCIAVPASNNLSLLMQYVFINLFSESNLHCKGEALGYALIVFSLESTFKSRMAGIGFSAFRNHQHKPCIWCVCRLPSGKGRIHLHLFLKVIQETWNCRKISDLVFTWASAYLGTVCSKLECFHFTNCINFAGTVNANKYINTKCSNVGYL